MNILQMLRTGLLGFRGSKQSNNNRKMTKGRVASGKSTFKGSQKEQDIVNLKKDIEEKARMILAIDIKLDSNGHDSVERKALIRDKDELTDELNSFLDEFEQVASSKRFNLVMEELDQEERHRRKVRDLQPMAL